MQNNYREQNYNLCFKVLLDFVKYYVYDYYLESTKNDVISFYRSRFSQESLRIYEEVILSSESASSIKKKKIHFISKQQPA